MDRFTAAWQNAAMIITVVSAVAWLVRRLLKAATATNATRCGGCTACPARTPRPEEFVSLGTGTTHTRHHN